MAALGGQGEPRRWRFNAPAHVTSRSGAERWGKDQLARVLRGEAPRTTRPARAKAAGEQVERREAEQRAAREAVTVACWAEEFVADSAARRVRPTTIAMWRSYRLPHVLAAMGDRRVREVGELDWQRLRRQLKHMAASTANNVIAWTQQLLSAAHKAGLRGPVERPARVRGEEIAGRPESYTVGEFEHLVATARGLGRHFLAVVLLGGDAGLRRGEIAGVRAEDVEGGEVYVRRTIVTLNGERLAHLPKSGKARRVPVSPRLLEVLRELAADSPDGWLVRGRRGEPATGRTVSAAAELVRRAAGLDHGGAHTLRHTFASQALEAGASLREVQELLGHSSALQTEVYLHTNPAGLRSAVARLSALRRDGTDLEPRADEARPPGKVHVISRG